MTNLEEGDRQMDDDVEEKEKIFQIFGRFRGSFYFLVYCYFSILLFFSFF